VKLKHFIPLLLALLLRSEAAAQGPLCPTGSTLSQAGLLDVTTGAEFAGQPLEAARDGDPATFTCYSDGGAACEAPGPGGPGMQVATSHPAAEIVSIETASAAGCSIAATLIEATIPPYRSRIIFSCLDDGPLQLSEFHYCVATPAAATGAVHRLYLPLVIKN